MSAKKVGFNLLNVDDEQDAISSISHSNPTSNSSQNFQWKQCSGAPGTGDLVRMWVESQCSCAPLNRRWHSTEHIACLHKAHTLCDSLFKATDKRNNSLVVSNDENMFECSKDLNQSSNQVSWGESLDSMEMRIRPAWSPPALSGPIPWYKLSPPPELHIQGTNDLHSNLQQIPADSLEFL